MNKMSLSVELTWRGFVNQTTFKSVTQIDDQKLSFYWGVDPSAPSMTIGNLAAAMMVRHFIEHGHKAYLLIGGATGLIGDPDGKATERTLKSAEEVAQNKAAIIKQYKQVFAGLPFEIVDNYDWFKDIGYLEFLRDIGKHVPMRQMLSRDFVQSRLSEGGAGISYAEFSYSLIQGYDFLHLSRQHGITLQLCGSDQWGNSIAGVELIRRIDAKEAHIWSTPLIINKSTGIKFGKSEGGAVWLDPAATSVYDFYQFWLNVDDEGVEDYLKIYTLLDKARIDSTIATFEKNRAERFAQKTLAYEVTALVHGEEAAEQAKKDSEKLFGVTNYQDFDANDFSKLGLEVFPAQPGANLIEMLVATRLASSNTEARRFVQQQSIYINGKQASADKQQLEDTDFVSGHVVLRRGKNMQVLLTQK